MNKKARKNCHEVNKVLKKDVLPIGQTMARILISVSEWCQITGFGRTLANKLLRDGSLHSIKVRGRRLILASECVEFPRRMSDDKNENNKKNMDVAND